MFILKIQFFSSVRGEALIYGHPAGCRFISVAHIMVSGISHPLHPIASEWGQINIIANEKLFVMLSNAKLKCGEACHCFTTFITNFQCMLSCCDLCCFGAKPDFSQFKLFCVEQKINQTCGTNIARIANAVQCHN